MSVIDSADRFVPLMHIVKTPKVHSPVFVGKDLRLKTKEELAKVNFSLCFH